MSRYNPLLLKNQSVNDTVNITIIQDGYSTAVKNWFGFSLQNSLTTQSKGTAGNYWVDSSEAQALINDLPRVTLRAHGGTDTWANSRNTGYNGLGSKYHQVRGVIPPRNADSPGGPLDPAGPSAFATIYQNSFDRSKAYGADNDNANEHNINVKFEATTGNYTSETGSHSYVTNYHQDWDDGVADSYDDRGELWDALSSNEYGITELGNENNASGYRTAFPNTTDFMRGGYGWDPTSQDFVSQSRAFGRNVSTNVRTRFANMQIAITAPPPTWLVKIMNGFGTSGLTGSELYNKGFTDTIREDVITGDAVFNAWIHHIYNETGNFTSKVGGLRSEVNIKDDVLNLIAKGDVTGSQLGDYPFHGIKASYVEYIWRNYIFPYEDYYPGFYHTVTEWGYANEGTGVGDTLLGGMNIMKYLLAFPRVDRMSRKKIDYCFYQKLYSLRPPSRIPGDRAYCISLIFPSLGTSTFWQDNAIYNTTDFHPTVGFKAFELFKPVESGNYLGTYKILNNTSAVIDEDVSIELYDDGSSNQYLFYANASDSDLTINLSGTNVYVQGDTTGAYSGTGIVDEWISGTHRYDGLGGTIAGYPYISINSASSDNTLRARTFGRIAL